MCYVLSVTNSERLLVPILTGKSNKAATIAVIQEYEGLKHAGLNLVLVVYQFLYFVLPDIDIRYRIMRHCAH